jgi:hypothetical protein
MFELTAASRARDWIWTKFGMEIAARTPITTTTIMSSIRVKPWVRTEEQNMVGTFCDGKVPRID